MRRVSALVMLAAVFPAVSGCASEGGQGGTTTEQPMSSELPATPGAPTPAVSGGQSTTDQQNPQLGNTSPQAGSGPTMPPASPPPSQEPGADVTPNTPVTVNPDTTSPVVDPTSSVETVNPSPNVQPTTGVSPEPNTSDDGTTNDSTNTGVEPTTTDNGTGGENMPQADVDQNGKANAAPGESTSAAQDYLRLGEIRILNNNWGSAELGCDTQMSVFVNPDKSFGWDFNRGGCGGGGSQPDFPQIEFGIHPFGIGDELVTSPEFSSTTLLPTQIKNISSASITVDNLNIALQGQQAWNITMEFWLSERDPVNDPNPGVYAEVMAFWGWQGGRWPCDGNGDGMPDQSGDSVQAGNMSYKLCHQVDDWANNQWRYFQFRAGDGSDGNSKTSFSGTIDVKAFLDYVVNNRNYSQDLWVTRLEVGSEIDDNTGGRVTLNNITFEINGESRSPVFTEQ